MPWDTSKNAVLNRFWSKVDKSGDCWLWRGSVTGRGYGRFSYLNSPMQAHRMSWVLTRGDIPDGHIVCHKCDTPLCVKPEHLFLGTHNDNMRDMTKKNRSNAKLTESQAREVWELLQRGVPKGEISRRFGIARQSVQDINRGQSWKSVTGLSL